jgi:hypothetical protein
MPSKLYLGRKGGTLTGPLIGTSITGTSLVKTGGLSTEFLKADGSIDNSSYLTTSGESTLYLAKTGGTLTGPLIGTSITGDFLIKSGGLSTEFLKADGSIDNSSYLTTSGESTLYLEKTGGTLTGPLIGTSITGTSLVKSGGLSTEFIKADGSIDNSSYLTTSGANTLYLAKTGGTLTGPLIGTSLIKSGGLSTEFLKADGSIDNSSYLTTSGANTLYLAKTGGTLTGPLTGTSITGDSLIKSGGLSTEFLKADGSIDNSSYLTPITVTTTGYPFNPVNRLTTIITSGTKSYWFCVLISQPTLISGYNVYLSSGSGDIFRMGIYRGYLKTGAGSNPGANITLVGQSASALTTSGLPFNRAAISAKAGQNLRFTNGEYMTIAFHSQGSTSYFLGSPASGSAVIDLAYTTANYASAGFPAILSQTSITGSQNQRPCFELY